MGLLTLGALAAGGCLLRSEYEKRQLKLPYYTVESEKLPDCFDGVKIALLADLHGKQFGHENEELYRFLKAAQPDYILSAGDLILKTKPWDTAEVARFIGRLTKICPVYCANGNHELELRETVLSSGGTESGACGSSKGSSAYDRYIDLMKKYGITVLADETAVLERDGETIDVSGLDLGVAYYAKAFHVPMRSDYIKRKLGTPKPDRFHILLGHYPNYFAEYAAWGADLVLAGHMHGGTVRFPVVGGLMSPNYEFFPTYDKGLFEKKGAHMVVSAGLGTHSVNIRFGGNYPEVPMIVLKKKR